MDDERRFTVFEQSEPYAPERTARRIVLRLPLALGSLALGGAMIGAAVWVVVNWWGCK